MPSLTLADAAARTTRMAEPKKGWIKKAVKPENRGKFRAKAEAAGKSTRAFAAEHKDDSGTLGKEARLAQTLMGMSKRKKASPLYDHERSPRHG
jgi:hypothetical protein